MDLLEAVGAGGLASSDGATRVWALGLDDEARQATKLDADFTGRQNWDHHSTAYTIAVAIVMIATFVTAILI